MNSHRVSSRSSILWRSDLIRSQIVSNLSQSNLAQYAKMIQALGFLPPELQDDESHSMDLGQRIDDPEFNLSTSDRSETEFLTPPRTPRSIGRPPVSHAHLGHSNHRNHRMSHQRIPMPIGSVANRVLRFPCVT